MVDSFDPQPEELGIVMYNDPAIYPSATETIDGKDNNCDGLVGNVLLIDSDLDGYASTESGETDCNDSDANVNPGKSIPSDSHCPHDFKVALIALVTEVMFIPQMSDLLMGTGCYYSMGQLKNLAVIFLSPTHCYPEEAANLCDLSNNAKDI